MKQKILYKYRSVSNLLELERLLDIFQNKRLYFPKYEELNDPLEGAGYNIEVDGWAGMGMQIAADDELKPIQAAKERYRILSLASDPVSPQLWAHYTNNYNGVCLCFKTDGRFGTAKKVCYDQKLKIRKAFDQKILDKAVRENFFYKQKDWSYEKEWRIVKHVTDDNRFFDFCDDELVGIVIGSNLSTMTQQIIVSNINSQVKVMKTKIGYRSFQIHLLPWDYEYEHDGSKPRYIGDIEAFLLS